MECIPSVSNDPSKGRNKEDEKEDSKNNELIPCFYFF